MMFFASTHRNSSLSRNHHTIVIHAIQSLKVIMCWGGLMPGYGIKDESSKNARWSSDISWMWLAKGPPCDPDCRPVLHGKQRGTSPTFHQHYKFRVSTDSFMIPLILSMIEQLKKCNNACTQNTVTPGILKQPHTLFKKVPKLASLPTNFDGIKRAPTKKQNHLQQDVF